MQAPPPGRPTPGQTRPPVQPVSAVLRLGFFVCVSRSWRSWWHDAGPTLWQTPPPPGRHTPPPPPSTTSICSSDVRVFVCVSRWYMYYTIVVGGWTIIVQTSVLMLGFGLCVFVIHVLHYSSWWLNNNSTDISIDVRVWSVCLCDTCITL